MVSHDEQLEDAFCAFAMRANTLDEEFVETIALTIAQRGDAICSICAAPIRAHVIAPLRVNGPGDAFALSSLLSRSGATELGGSARLIYPRRNKERVFRHDHLLTVHETDQCALT